MPTIAAVRTAITYLVCSRIELFYTRLPVMPQGWCGDKLIVFRHDG
jgi:hypothetical protein